MKRMILHPVSFVLGLATAGLLLLPSRRVTEARSGQSHAYEYTSVSLCRTSSPTREVFGAWIGEHAEEYGLKKEDGNGEQKDASIPEALRRFGAHGWELVAVVREERDLEHSYVFKRPLPDTAER